MCSEQDDSSKAPPIRKPHNLKLVGYHHPILRKAMEPLTFPLKEQDKHIITDMVFSIQSKQLKKAKAPWKHASGMAANQWGCDKRIFLFCPEADTVNRLSVIINPSYEPLMDENLDTEIGVDTNTDTNIDSNTRAKAPVSLEASDTEAIDYPHDFQWESCFSVPLATGLVKRYSRIKVTYQNENGETITQILSGYYARVWQHENDHLNGFLYDDSRAGKCVKKHSFSSIKGVNEFFNKLRDTGI